MVHFSKLEKIFLFFKLGGVLFLKAGGYETVRIHSKRSSSSYWYSFDYRGKVELLRLGSVDGSIIPPGIKKYN